MNKLIQEIEIIRQKIPALRRHSLKETSTRTIIIDPLLEALGWDVRDPDEVQLEYPTVDNKSVDYALKLNKKPVLLVEAKALDDQLTDVKAITQVVGYAANDGIVWCVLTNGLKWQVYRSVEKCAAPDKLMFEVTLDPDKSEGMTVHQIAKQMWRFSLEEMAKGTLDALGEQTFTDGKVRKAIQMLMIDPPRPLLNLIRRTAADNNLNPQQIRNSLSRIAGETISFDLPKPVGQQETLAPSECPIRSQSEKKDRKARGTKKGESPFNEEQHLSSKPQEAIQLYRAIDRLCLSFSPGDITKRYLKKTINYNCNNHCFCSVHILKGGLRVWLRLKYARLEQAPFFARDVSSIGHWGTGDLELRISNLSELEESADLIRRSFEAMK